MLRYLCRKLLYGISTTEGGGVSVVGAIYSCSILSKLEHEQRRKFYSAFISRNDRNDLVALCLELTPLRPLREILINRANVIVLLFLNGCHLAVVQF